MSSIQLTQPEQNNSINMLVSILIRFPHILSVKTNSSKNTFSIFFMLKSKLESKIIEDFEYQLAESLEAYQEITEEKGPEVFSAYKSMKELAILEVTYKHQDLCMRDISLVAGLVAHKFEEYLLAEFDGYSTHPDFSHLDAGRQVEFMINEITEQKDSLIAYRDSGKVYVFDK